MAYHRPARTNPVFSLSNDILAPARMLFAVEALSRNPPGNFVSTVNLAQAFAEPSSSSEEPL